jgi:hypothetical protein
MRKPVEFSTAKFPEGSIRDPEPQIMCAVIWHEPPQIGSFVQPVQMCELARQQAVPDE